MNSPKKCTKCGKEKIISKDPKISEFYRDKKGHYIASCKTCEHKRSKRYRMANPEKISYKNKQYIEKYYSTKNHITILEYFKIKNRESRFRKKEALIKEFAEQKGLKIPKTLSDCENHPEPCPWIRCKHHMIWDIWNRIKSMTNNQIVSYLYKMPVTCLFDLTKRDHNLRECGEFFNITRERVRQIQDKALNKIKFVKSKRDMVSDYIFHENRHPIDNSIYFNLTDD